MVQEMRGAALACALAVLTGASGAAFAQKLDPIGEARAFYNQRNFDAAIQAAEQARAVPARADSADLIAARAYLERFRETAAADDLTNARERLRRLNPQRLAPPERTEFLVGLGEALFFDGSYGAAADVFESVLTPAGMLAADMREPVLDWWATAIDRDARVRVPSEREERYQRIRDRMAMELAARPGSAAAAYWRAAAARGMGDLQAAWDAAQAAWVRAPLASDYGAALRADVDRLMLNGIVPERAKAMGQSSDQVKAEWEAFKEKWTK
jgi:hypothetical protein